MSLDPCEEVGSWEPSRNNRLTGDLSPSLRPGKRAHNTTHLTHIQTHLLMSPTPRCDPFVSFPLHTIAIGRIYSSWDLSVVGVCKRVMAMAKSKRVGK